MTRHLMVAMLALTLFPVSSFASIIPRFDAQRNIWNSTHIVVVEGGRVVESWMGDLKAGDALSEGAARFTRIPVPGPDPRRAGPDGKLPRVSGKRMVLFLAHVPQMGEDPKKRVWMGANAPGHPSNPVSETAVAWIESDRVFHVTPCAERYALMEDGGTAGLKQRVDLCLALRAQFDAAKADTDPRRRAERLAVLTPTVSRYAGYYGQSDCVEELGKCGRAAVPYLTDWVLEPKAEFADSALSCLGYLGDDGIDGMLKVLDEETGYWKSVAQHLEPFQWVDQIPHRDQVYRWRGPHRLRTVLAAAQRMNLSAKNKELLQKHAGLVELEKLFRTEQGMKPPKTPMVEAHKILQDILAGKIGAE